MTAADDYNASQITAGKLTTTHITALVKHWQASTAGLEVDGKAGPQTIASIEATLRPVPFLAMPLPTLPDGRRPTITSRFKTHEPERPTHDGVDLFYVWKPGDKPDKVADGGAAGKNPDGTPRWGVPYGTLAIAAATGVVTKDTGPSKTGWRCWIDHGNGLRSGYFHMTELRVNVGQTVVAGQAVGVVGDNPDDKGDARHLHFEVSPVNNYSPLDPELFLIL